MSDEAYKQIISVLGEFYLAGKISANEFIANLKHTLICWSMKNK